MLNRRCALGIAAAGVLGGATGARAFQVEVWTSGPQLAPDGTETTRVHASGVAS